MIPPILHTFWGGPPMPDHIRYFIGQWQYTHPDYELRLWTPNNRPPSRFDDIYEEPERWSPRSNPWQFRADLLRFEFLHDYGGVWIDADLEPLRRIDDLLKWEVFHCRENERFVNNGFCGAERGSSWTTDLLDGMRERLKRFPDSRTNIQIGPHYVTDMLRSHPEVHLVPRELAYPFNYNELDRRWATPRPDAYTRHHWNHRTGNGFRWPDETTGNG